MRYKDRGVRPVVRVHQTSRATREKNDVKNLTTRCSTEEHWWREGKLANHLPSGKHKSVALIELEWSMCSMNYRGRVVFPRKLSRR